MENRIIDPVYAARAMEDCCGKSGIRAVRGLCSEGHRAIAYWVDVNGGGGLEVLEQRLSEMPADVKPDDAVNAMAWG